MDQENLILTTLISHPQTANEVISSIFFEDQLKHRKREGWKFYVHLNKDFAPLEKKGLIRQIGTKINEKGREEKLWQITDLTKAKFEKISKAS